MNTFKRVDREDIGFFLNLMPGRVITQDEFMADYTHDEMTE